MDTATKPALIYCRVSTKGQGDEDEEEDEKTSLQRQEQSCVDKLRELGYTDWDTRREVVSGTSMYNRPILLRILDDLKTGKYGALIVHKKDRLARKAIHQLMIIDDCQRRGVQFVSVLNPVDNTPMGQFMAYTEGFVAEYELELIKERTLGGKRQNALNGKIHNFGAELYGYRRNRATAKRETYDPEAAIVCEVYSMIVSERGIPPPSAGKYAYSDPDRKPLWHAPQIINMVRNIAYKGETLAWANHPESEQIHLPDGVTPPIVSPALWQQAQDIIS
jgi:site-specific DNA recombinase